MVHVNDLHSVCGGKEMCGNEWETTRLSRSKDCFAHGSRICWCVAFCARIRETCRIIKGLEFGKEGVWKTHVPVGPDECGWSTNMQVFV